MLQIAGVRIVQLELTCTLSLRPEVQFHIARTLICCTLQNIIANFCFCTWQEFKRETRFTSKCSANEIVNKIEEAAKPLGFDVQKKNYKVS